MAGQGIGGSNLPTFSVPSICAKILQKKDVEAGSAKIETENRKRQRKN